jgi:hypothetical protein
MKHPQRGVSLQSVLTAAGLGILLLALPVTGQVVYVSPCGLDTNAGVESSCFLDEPPFDPNPFGPKRNIQPAIDAVAAGGTVLVAAGSYRGPVDFRGKAVTVEGDGATIVGTGGTVVICNSEEGPDSRLIGFTITGGSAPFGGGMYVGAESSPTVIDCAFNGNAAGVSGGGMYVGFESHPTVTGCVFSGNTAAEGGGMANASESNPAVSDCAFTGNASTGDGGGMHNDSESSPAVTGCTFSDNTAGGDGGGMANRLESNPLLTNCGFNGNTAGGDGGGLANQLESNPMLTNCGFNGNTAGGAGGALSNTFESSPRLTNCTLVGNVAHDSGAAIACFFESAPILANCVIWGNSSGAAEATAPIRADGESAPWITYSFVEGGWTGAGGTGNVSADPRLVDALGPDGLPGTGDEDLRLAANSPCIDAGDNPPLRRCGQPSGRGQPRRDQPHRGHGRLRSRRRHVGVTTGLGPVAPPRQRGLLAVDDERGERPFRVRAPGNRSQRFLVDGGPGRLRRRRQRL